MSRLTDIDNYLVVENGQIKESTFKQDIQIQNQILTINEDAKVQIIYKATQEGDYQFDITLKEHLHVDLIEMYEASTKCRFTKNIKVNESCEVLRYVEKNSHENISIDLDENVDVCANAHISCAYVELTDYSTFSKVKYQLLEEGASARLRLASLSKELEHKHYEMTLEHLAPHTYGDMDNYGIVKSKASLLIDGIGRIHKGMYQSDTHQTKKSLFLMKVAKPKEILIYILMNMMLKQVMELVLEKLMKIIFTIYNHVVFLQDAMHLVTYGYFLPVLEFISVDSLKERFSDVLKEKVGL